MSDWIKWHGETDMEPTDGNTRVRVTLRTGEVEQGLAREFRWQHYGHGSDIVSYQIGVWQGDTPEDPLDIPIPDIADMLAERGKRYGEFTEHARITQDLKTVMRDTPQWLNMGDDQKECLEMITHKIGRILNGDPHYYDSWKDIAGYAKLVSDRLEKENGD